MAPYLIRYPLVPQEGSEGIKPESRVVMKCLILSRLFGLAPILASYVPTLAGMFTWSNIPIVGEDPLFIPSGMAVFEISGGNILTLTLTNESPQILATGEALPSLTWDITDAGVTLFPDNTVIPRYQNWLGLGQPMIGFILRMGLQGQNFGGGLGSFGIGAMGDINFGTDTFDPRDRFDITTNLSGPSICDSLNGIDGAIVGPSVDLISVDSQLRGRWSKG